MTDDGRKAAGDEARRFIDALHRLEADGDVEAIVPLFDERARLSNPTDAQAHEGTEGAREFWSQYRASFEDIHSEFRHVVADGGSAMLEWRSRGRTASGADFTYDGVSVLEFGDGGRIRRFRAYFDPHDLTAGADGDRTAGERKAADAGAGEAGRPQP